MYGKRKKKNRYKLVSSENKLLKLISQTTFRDKIIYNESLCVVIPKKKSIILS